MEKLENFFVFIPCRFSTETFVQFAYITVTMEYALFLGFRQILLSQDVQKNNTNFSKKKQWKSFIYVF